jgi:peptidoglycan hydrolase-like protein with peptidoglycan-binding domain
MNTVQKFSGILILGVFFSIFSMASAQEIPPITTPYVSTGSHYSCVSLTYDLHYGVSDSTTAGQVSILQNFLYVRGYLSVPATGYFGPLTFQAVKAFQAASGSGAIDGIVGPQTRAHVIAASCGLTNPVLPSTTPSISMVTPSQGSVGTTVTLTGTNFDSSDILHFAAGAISGYSVGNAGTTITFTIPSSIGPYCKPDVMCPAYAMLVTNGTYQVSVENSAGTSNTVPLVVTGATTL